MNRTFVTRLAWELRTPIRRVELGHGQAVVFRSEDSLSGPPAALRGRRGHARVLVRVGAWEVVRREQLRLTGASVTRFSHFPHQ